MKRKLVALCLVMLFLVGCGADSELTQLTNLESMNTESKSSDPNLSYSEKESLVYAQVSERSLLDMSKLEPCSDADLQAVVTYMETVDKQLTGQLDRREGVIDEQMTNYLLSEFQKTPYYWQRSQTVIRGMDSESRSIVVDVTYNTIGFNKEVKDKSVIVRGEPDYSKKIKIRYDRWLNILQGKYNNASDFEWQEQLNEFKKIYGDPEVILDVQKGLSLTDQIFETGNQKTYPGCVDSEVEKQGATMTVRFVLVPTYMMGVNLGLNCKHLYIYDYSINADPTEGLDIFQEEGYSEVTQNVTRVLKSYFKCIEENYFDGLYNLTYHFDGLDNYYKDMFDTAYMKYNNFTVSIFDILGTKITCGVQVSSKVRSKGSNMTFPLYSERYYVEMQLVDDKLQVVNMVLLSRRLEGEPAITSDEADSSGFSREINLSIDAKKEIEQLICKFGEIQLNRDTQSPAFTAVVDTSMSENKLTYLKENMLSIGGQRKVVWLQNYQSGNSNYVSVRCKEQYQNNINEVMEAVTSYEFINKGGQWYVYGFDVLSSLKLNTTNLTRVGALCLIDGGKTVEYESQAEQISGAVATGASATIGATDTASGSAASVAVVYNHEEETPHVKISSGTPDSGLVKLTPEMVTETQINSYLAENKDKLGDGVTYEDVLAIDKEMGNKSTELGSLTQTLREFVAIYYNIINNRYNKIERKEVLEDIQARIVEYKPNWGASDLASNLNSIFTRFQ